MEATILVFVYRAGLLARLAHDLQLTMVRHELTVQGRHVRGTCEAKSLDVDGVMTESGLDRRILSYNDCQMIRDAIRSQVLQTEIYPRIEFEGEVTGHVRGKLQVCGTLQVCGRSRNIQAELTIDGDHVYTDFDLTPSEFGIPPFKALAGAIKTQDYVRVTLRLRLKGVDPASVLESTDLERITAAD
jgi:hypothetical protein